MLKNSMILEEALKEKVSNPTKTLTISLDEARVRDLDLVARILAEERGKTFTRNKLIEQAIEGYLAEAFEKITDKGIDIEKYKNTTTKSKCEFFNCVVYPAHDEGFIETFLNEGTWYYVKINKDKIPKIKYVAIYRNFPTSGITHYAKVKEYEYVEEQQGYRIIFDGDVIELDNFIPLGNVNAASTRAPRYTTLTKLLSASEYKDLYL